MNSRSLGFALALATASLLAISLPSVAAQGDWLLRGGVGYVDPKDDNLGIAPGVDLQVDEGVSATVEGTYMFADKWGVELLAAWPFEHDVKLDGVGEVAEVTHLPPTLSLQYHFNPEGRFRPYAGVGVNYTLFSDEETKGALAGSKLRLDNSWGVGAQVGADIALKGNWFANVVVRYLDIEADAELDGDKLGTIEIDPFVYQAQIGYRFGRAAPAPVQVAAPLPAPAPKPAAPEPVAPPPDSDGDGVVDAADQCPDTPKGDQVDARGCSCHVSRQVTFELNSAELDAEGETMLDEMAVTLQRLGFISGTVTGHTDSSGAEDYNQQLSLRRAQAVATYLEGKGLTAGRLQVRGMGESEPVADNATPEGRAMNRRVIISRSDCDAN